MSDFNKVVIEITKTGARIESVSLNGSKNVKTVSVADLASVFAKNAVLDSGILPTSDGIVYYGHHSDKEVVVYTKPPMVRTLSFRQTKYRVPVPRSYFFVVLAPNPQNGTKKIVHTRMYGGHHIIRKKTDYLRKFPFCNVYGGGNICWGANSLSPIRDLYGVEYYFELFWSSPFNGDLEPRLVPRFKYNPANGNIIAGHVDEYDREETSRSVSVSDTQSYFKWADKAKAEEFDSSSLPNAGSFNEALHGLVGNRE